MVRAWDPLSGNRAHYVPCDYLLLHPRLQWLLVLAGVSWQVGIASCGTVMYLTSMILHLDWCKLPETISDISI